MKTFDEIINDQQYGYFTDLDINIIKDIMKEASEQAFEAATECTLQKYGDIEKYTEKYATFNDYLKEVSTCKACDGTGIRYDSDRIEYKCDQCR